jgi:hypothetical protein
VLFDVEGFTQTILGTVEKLLVGVGFTVTKTVCAAEAHAGVPLLIILKVRVLTPEEAQLTRWGPAPVSEAGEQPAQFQINCAPIFAVPVKLRVERIVLVAKTFSQTFCAVKVGTGVGNTITNIVEIGLVQTGLLGLLTAKVRVLVPAVAQLSVWGPWVVGGVTAHPSQNQV